MSNQRNDGPASRDQQVPPPTKAARVQAFMESVGRDNEQLRHAIEQKDQAIEQLQREKQQLMDLVRQYEICFGQLPQLGNQPTLPQNQVAPTLPALPSCRFQQGAVQTQMYVSSVVAAPLPSADAASSTAAIAPELNFLSADVVDKYFGTYGSARDEGQAPIHCQGSEMPSSSGVPVETQNSQPEENLFEDSSDPEPYRTAAESKDPSPRQ